MYPVKKARAGAEREFLKINPDAETLQRIIADVERRISGEWQSIDERYIPYALNYLAQRRWEDEIGEPESDSTFDEIRGPNGEKWVRGPYGRFYD